MSMARRLIDLEERRFREAVAEFAAFWKPFVLRPARQEYVRARLREVGFEGHDLAALERWHAAQPPDQRAIHDAVEAAIFGMVLRPHDGVGIRTGLAAIAPELGLDAHTPPVLIIRALRATIEAEDACERAS